MTDFSLSETGIRLSDDLPSASRNRAAQLLAAARADAEGLVSYAEHERNPNLAEPLGRTAKTILALCDVLEVLIQEGT